MALIDPVVALCKKLSLHAGWNALMTRHGLNLGAANLAKALSKSLTIDRGLSGFGDFASDGVRAIEPGSPSRSLLYHALASPNVLQDPSGVPLDLFPTPAELDAVENYIFGVQKVKLADIIARFPGKRLAVAVFACEYRPGSETVHRKHADMAFSRSGNARVGNRAARYVPAFRGFHPEVPTEPYGIAVTPARYVAYLAVQLTGADPRTYIMGKLDGDGPRRFWVPVHKLFSGPDCLDGLNLAVDFSSQHINEKIFRAQKAMGMNPPDAPPYRLVKGLAELSPDPALGPGWIVPVAHPHLVEEAKDAAGKDVTFKVPRDDAGNWATVDLWSKFNTQSAPEYLHARTEVLPDGTRRDLNQINGPSRAFPKDSPVDARVKKGGYQALHYVDFTADGFVAVNCPQVQGVGGVEPTSISAYSIIAAPDFFPATGQRELMEWVQSNAIAAESLKKQIWGSVDRSGKKSISPESLNAQRFPANLQLPNSPFRKEDTTVTAIVGLPLAPANSPVPQSDVLRRQSYLPDDGAGVFAPGWEVSMDELGPTKHLAAYGLGSPFPEDSKLCAALSSYWPAVAPDITRSMDPAPNANLSGTVIPMTDAEIGQSGTLPWDGIPGPTEIVVGGKAFAEYNSFLHADYVQNALADKFSLRLTSKVEPKAYMDRIFAMLCGYLAMGVERVGGTANPALTDLRGERNQWIVLSFKELTTGDPELTQATIDTGVSPHGPYFRATVFRNGVFSPSPTNFQKRRIEITGRLELIIAPADRKVFLRKPAETAWRNGVVNFS